ncbi:hypothetical protein C6B38_00755, partial [Spiroplasma sp. ChiS]|uniref:hypothetical protein n=1 Tax=Spiroplasma sp. ChiS TaxID=2099885 RepID=UPI000D4C44F8
VIKLPDMMKLIFCYKIAGYDEINIFNKEMEYLITIDKKDNTVSINNYIEKLKKELEFLELILKENK